MTFDEAVREYQLRSSIGPLVQGIELSRFVNVPQQEYDRVKFLNNLFYETINKLRKEYAPPVKMTKNDRDILLHNLQNYPFDVFAESIALSDKEKFGLSANKEFKGLSIENLMQAWLHPETIKIVDE
ncbi:hypothetical protein [Leuconostoc pseudomesenteroides]|uniref:hypothetical protein n=1 Tax=Leuconostoc pseudomesenteroides TaxID=33968 RepID=UPI00166364A8|nr:hypothetical protein [Leuconostoc pseudomesenteroides]